VSAEREAELAASRIGPPRRLDGQVLLSDYNTAWPSLFEGLAARLRSSLGDRVLELHHAGSTSVPGLAAKPVIDMILIVADSADEGSYLAPLDAAGFALAVREPDWFEHRCLRHSAPDANLHVFSQGCPEIRRMLAFRDHLRTDQDDRRLYEETKRALAARTWAFMQDYADAKSEVVAAIMERALR
jgi:GrpB-like predicted nucleotidyltransferase (UPF0157 family)